MGSFTYIPHIHPYFVMLVKKGTESAHSSSQNGYAGLKITVLTVISKVAAVVLIWNGEVLIFTSVLTARQQNRGLHPVKGMRDGNLQFFSGFRWKLRP